MLYIKTKLVKIVCELKRKVVVNRLAWCIFYMKKGVLEIRVWLVSYKWVSKE